MFGFFNKRTKAPEPTAPTYMIQKYIDGRWYIYDEKGEDIGRSYARRRDAFRGAERAGLKVA